METTPKKVPILANLADFRTAHLQPVIDFLKAQGNEPATGDQFHYNRDGLGVYGFAQPLNTQLLQEYFDFPPSISLSADGLHDSRHFVRIQHTPALPVRRFSFDASRCAIRPNFTKKNRRPRSGGRRCGGPFASGPATGRCPRKKWRSCSCATSRARLGLSLQRGGKLR